MGMFKSGDELVSPLAAEKAGFFWMANFHASDFVNTSETDHSTGSNRDLSEL
jgi:hypothetical protein